MKSFFAIILLLSLHLVASCASLPPDFDEAYVKHNGIYTAPSMAKNIPDGFCPDGDAGCAALVDIYNGEREYCDTMNLDDKQLSHLFLLIPYCKGKQTGVFKYHGGFGAQTPAMPHADEDIKEIFKEYCQDKGYTSVSGYGMPNKDRNASVMIRFCYK